MERLEAYGQKTIAEVQLMIHQSRDLVYEWSKEERIRTLFILREQEVKDGVDDLVEAQLPVAVDIDRFERISGIRSILHPELKVHPVELVFLQISVTVDIHQVK